MDLKFMVVFLFPSKCISRENTCTDRFIFPEIIFVLNGFILNRTVVLFLFSFSFANSAVSIKEHKYFGKTYLFIHVSSVEIKRHQRHTLGKTSENP